MDAFADPSLLKFGIGQPVPRKEDPVLLRGEGRYTDDLSLPGQVHGVMVRSRHAHGVIRAIDTAEARGMHGVLGIYTGADLIASGMGKMPAGMTFNNRDGSAMHCPDQLPLTTDRVRYVGDPVAIVVAETAKQARDAAETVALEVDPLPAVTEARAAVAAGAPQLHDAAPGNVALDWHHGDAAKVADAFARAAHVTRLGIRNTRIVVCPMEPRSALASIEDGRPTLRVGSQGVFGLRALLHRVLGGKLEDVRVLTGNVGGSFGMKASAYPEYFALLHAARTLGRPVKWTDERSESFVSDAHGRDHDMDCELALDRDGHILALRITGFGNLGAYLSNATVLPSTGNAVKNSIGVYRTPLIEVSTRCVFTNTTPVGPYRGAGRPEGNYYIERLLDTAAREMRIDRVELRRRNHITPEMMPYAAPSGMHYDSGDFPAVLDDALAFAEADGFAARRAESRARGRLRGFGIGQYLEVTAPPTNEMGGISFDADGGVTITTGTLDYGQGHASPFAQVLVERLGVPFERIRLHQGDSDRLVAGGGTGGSKSMMTSGAAIWEASDLVIERGRQIAAAALEAAPADIEFSAGRFAIVGTDRGIGIMELAERLREGTVVPPEGMPASLDVVHVFKEAPSAFPNGCHVAEVEIDPETGVVAVVRYAMVNDFGVMVNPLLVEGQAHGGVVQGIGQALSETVVYDADGQIVTGSYMDYGLPRADSAPSFGFASHPVPARTNILGAKGCGEAGCAGALPAVMNAVVDALAEFGITHLDMPATPQRVWAAIEAAREQRAA
ncbi:MAG TPA: xanthine dehydrogenase family protein molybdopterin-binding subunit [Acetobacteraceae bacterium]|nr:xanthine dehydrogenase family protein molybdopterin-binding subunit [Acetobacteraceae bacterium]